MACHIYAAAPGASGSILAMLIGMLAVSSWVFATLVRRSTVHRERVMLADWARQHRARLMRHAAAELPAAWDIIARFHPQASLQIIGPGWSIWRLTTDPTDSKPSEARRWHVLCANLRDVWVPTGLRPASATASLLDLLSLTSFLSLAQTGRFVVFGADPDAATSLAKSRLETLMPPDIGLLLQAQWLMLDFSNRRFDTIELGRVLALARQLVEHLPKPQPEREKR